MMQLFYIVASCILLPFSCGFILPSNVDESILMRNVKKMPPISIDRLYHDIHDKKVEKIIFNQDLTEAVTLENDHDVFRTELHPLLGASLMEACIRDDIATSLVPVKMNIFRQILSYVLPLGLLYMLFNNIFRRFPAINNNMVKEHPTVNISDWAGSPEIFDEVYEVVTFLKNNENFTEIGATVPKGILLNGPPGTGKTLLAKAIAAETKAGFYPVVGSEFVELFVGMGASRIRNLFQQARENRPSIIFIDEIDAIGKKRSAVNINNNDEREQTLNQLLSEMDGFSSNDNLLVIAATNRKDTLDAALLRPGRFDRVITVPLPDCESRFAILKGHMKKKKTSTEITEEFIHTIAETTDGFSGAELSNLINEASILAVRNNRTEIAAVDMLEAVEKLLVGIVKRTDTRSEAIKKRVAIHEIGHALAVHMFSYFNLTKVCISPTYNGAGGYTMYIPLLKEDMYTRDYLFEKICIQLGGRAAEDVFYGKEGISTGAISDLQQANDLVHQVVRKFGMSDVLPHFYNDDDKTYSDHTLKTLEQETADILERAYQKVLNLIVNYKDIIEIMIPVLIRRSVLDGDEFASFFT